MSTEIYEGIANQIIAKLEQGVIPWRKPWSAHTWPKNLVSGKNYTGINALILGCLVREYDSAYWITFKQANQLGGSVRKGERGTKVIYCSVFEKKRTLSIPMVSR